MMLLSTLREQYAEASMPMPYDDQVDVETMAIEAGKERQFQCEACEASIFEQPLYFDIWLDVPLKRESDDNEEYDLDDLTTVFRREQSRVRCPRCMMNEEHAVEVKFPKEPVECRRLRALHEPVYATHEFEDADADAEGEPAGEGPDSEPDEPSAEDEPHGTVQAEWQNDE